MLNKYKLQVEAIENGCVIDHIPANVGIKILKLFNFDNNNQRITIGLNLPSPALGHKDLIKIENVFLSELQANQLALYAPDATVNKIEDYVVSGKLKLSLPNIITAVFSCPNSNCITHNEPVESSFNVIANSNPLQLKCKYCEKAFSRKIMSECN
ncbi:aspartate carbamoyltransferase regulatory subunit [Moritella sp. 24]|uniref:aspartate carbamoyltransferase regulatory subunit n=1 Tax=Moritella sp. 24 TaxID=2746230 RepID=UPI001BA4EEA2|nr:aspartate carbamoyltransferase regulatory subunit [Moritella sp. 24]QUM75016.1 aspartate carbamoyltransferase regulatory subunit [Moritella sp. 24]